MRSAAVARRVVQVGPISPGRWRAGVRAGAPGARVLIGVACASLGASTALAQTSSIIRTRESPSSTYDPLSPFSIGGGLEFERNNGQTRIEIPLRLEYNPSDSLRLSIEDNISHLDDKDFEVGSVGGLGDLETAIEYEFLKERRYTPALAVEGLIKWPTHTDADLGTQRYDFSLGIIASKDLVDFELELNLRYTFVGDPEAHDTIEASIAALIPIDYRFDLEAELAATDDSDTIETELTLGVAYHINKKATIEQGVTLRDDGTWQLVFGWSYSFGGD